MQNTVVAPKLFDFNSTDTYNGLWSSELSGNINLDNTHNPLARVLYTQMRANFWTPGIFPPSSYVRLQESGDVRSFERVISYLVFLDSLQVRMIPEFSRLIPDPEIRLVLAEHQSQEALHCESYQYIISNFPKNSRQYIYDGVKSDPLLKERCEEVTKPYIAYMENPTPENLLFAYFSDFLLESLLFTNGFMFFYKNVEYLAETAVIIKLIERK